MSIKHIEDGYIAECDLCGDILSPADTWNEARSAAKRERWKAFKDNGDWCLECAGCRELEWI